MNWITLSIVGAVAAWFEYNYQRSRRKRISAGNPLVAVGASADPPAHVEELEATPSIAPGSENDKKLNTTV